MYLYLVGAFDYNDDVLAVKIGVSSDIRERIAALQTGQFCEVRLLAAWQTDSRLKCFRVERALHEHYQHRRMCGEWFRRMVMRDIVPVASDLIGSLPCTVAGVPSHLAAIRDCQERQRERNQQHRLRKRALREARKQALAG